MNDKKNSRVRKAKLRRGKVKGVGLIEGMLLRVAGCIDGARNLPRDCGNGHWVSPHLDREIRSFDEFSSKIWGNLQIQNETEFARLAELMDSIERIAAELDAAEAELQGIRTSEEALSTSRKHGESKLSETQVRKRRATETAKRLDSFKSRINAIRSKLDSEVDKFSVLRNRLIEDNNSTRMVCTRVRDHLYQRINVYWNSALHKQTENTGMPAVPSIEVEFRSEALYLEPHNALMERADILCKHLSKYNNKEEALCSEKESVPRLTQLMTAGV